MPALEKYRVAAVQASPIYYDKEATTIKTVELIREAAAGGASLVVFPELWLPGYPFHLWLYPYPATLEFSRTYLKNSVTHEGPEAQAIRAVCKELKIMAVLGVNELDHGSLYMAQWIIGQDGEFIARRRKFRPTLVERTCFGEGDGSDIAVHDTPLGRIGALQCWEHVQPLLKYTMAAQHEEVHCASWPHFGPEMPHFSLSREANYSANSAYAVETGTYTIVSTAPLSKQNQDVLVNGNDELRKLMPVGGGLTQIFDPEGRPLCKMPEPDVEAIIYAEVDRSNCLLARAALDTVGHYARKDVFQVHFDNTPRHAIVVGPHGQATGGHKTRRTRAEVFGELVPTSIAVEEEEL